MSELGFYHPDRGYWQAIGGDPETLLAGYPEGTIEVPLKPGTDHQWQDGEWVHVPPTPEEIRAAMPALTARQLRLGLIDAGMSIAQVEAAIAAIEDVTEREKAQIEWEYATQFLRTHPLIDQIGAALELTPEQIGTMWQAASGL